ncbi:hypothetical protein [Streptomyces sp. SID3212]|uniref:hypothetical protein n=1 Tax=Streptomyces sp. SID3212 TaxID=2690259 RepID=UPI0013CCD13C|nr:hypothetical protein [Streptomyces sp. SID3212]MYV54443.1 hypothetical protein [Streptomyces sp. SID3212]
MRTTARLLTGTALAAAATVLSAGGASAAFVGGTAPSALAAPCEATDTRLGTADTGTDTDDIDTAAAAASADTDTDTADPLGTYGVPMNCENDAPATGDTLADQSEPADLDLGEDLGEPDEPTGADPNAQDRGGHDPGRHEPDGREPAWDHGRGDHERGDHGRDDPGREGREGHEPDGRTPRGHVNTGVGGSVAPDTTQIAVGAAVLAVAAVGGVTLLRRRASGAQGS